MTDNLVSVIIPTYNRAHVIQNALDSVLAQTHINWECIVVDDDSDDNTCDLVASYVKRDHRFKSLIRDRLPKGAQTCRNIGLLQAQGQYVIFLDSDDYLLPFCLERRLAYFKNHKDCDFLVFPMGVKSKLGILKREIIQSDSYLINFLKFELPWSIMCPIWRTTILMELGGFTEGYPRFNDPELMIRALLRNHTKFKVFVDKEFDCVYVYSTMNPKVFSAKIFESLFLFIPDVTKLLNDTNNISYKKYLSGYLHLWFAKFYIPSEINQIRPSLSLIKLFKINGVITIFKAIELSFIIIMYVTFNYFRSFFKRKLTRKSNYID
jgi:glycosyltransferase involved in cell wall biosynthesis